MVGSNRTLRTVIVMIFVGTAGLCYMLARPVIPAAAQSSKTGCSAAPAGIVPEVR